MQSCKWYVWRPRMRITLELTKVAQGLTEVPLPNKKNRDGDARPLITLRKINRKIILKPLGRDKKNN